VTKKPPDKQVEFLRTVLMNNLKAIAEYEDDIRIQTDVLPQRVIFTVFVHHDDIGLVLGSQGATTDAVRRILWTAAKKTDLKVDVDVTTAGVRAAR
jgi:predicted RNA-binding protein YlqC (UPF0109 family)